MWKTSLENTIFPIGNLLKSEVKKLALKIGLQKIATKKEVMIILLGNYQLSYDYHTAIVESYCKKYEMLANSSMWYV